MGLLDRSIMDTISIKKRSWNMSRIKSKDTSPELRVRKILTELGFRYRLHVNTLPGKPDLVLKKYKTAIYINGCFWHQHKGCKRSSLPKSNVDYWTPKLKRNIEKQKEDLQLLKDSGLNPLLIWECETKEINSSALKKSIYN